MDTTQEPEIEEINHESGDDNALTSRQERALRALSTYPNIKDAAIASGLSETTLWRYKKDATFARRVREVRREATKLTIMSLQEAAPDAVKVLRDLMTAEEVKDSSRISAARAVVEFTFRAAEIDELSARVEELEEFIRIKQVGDTMTSVCKSGNKNETPDQN